MENTCPEASEECYNPAVSNGAKSLLDYFVSVAILASVADFRRMCESVAKPMEGASLLALSAQSHE